MPYADHDVVAGLLDDAAMFPPGDMPIERAVPAHRSHHASRHAELVGSFVIAVKDLPVLEDVLRGDPSEAAELAIALTSPLDSLADAVRRASAIPGARIAVVEVALGADTDPAQVVSIVRSAIGEQPITAYVELPRDARRDAVLKALANTGILVKLRTGGVRADLYPSDRELAETLGAVVGSGVPFKATAGLHHALRNTDPGTGFEQHGFLNLLVAAAAAIDGRDLGEVEGILAERDEGVIAERVAALDPGVRRTFRSFGTCSVAEPVAELADLGLIPSDIAKDV